MDIKNNSKALSATNDSAGIISQPGATTTAKRASRGLASGAGASVVDSGVVQGQTPNEADNQKRQSENASRSIGKGPTREKLSAEDLNGGLLDGALDDVDDEDLDGDTEDTEMAHEGDGMFADQDNDDDERQLESSQQPGTEDESQTDVINGAEDAVVSSEDQENASHDDDDDEDPTAENEDEEEEEEGEEDEATPAAHSEDEGSELHDEESHHEGGDEDDDGIEDVEDVDEDDEPVTPVAKKDIAPTFSQKPILNQPQPIAEELNSGDDLSDLSDFEDTDDSEEEEHSVTNGSGKAKAESAAVSETRAKSSRPAFGRKRSLRETSRDSKGQEDIMKKEADDEYGEENNGRQSDKESESEIAEGEEAEDHGKVECDDDAEEEEEEDLEKKHLHMDALQALTTIEIEFSTLRDKMYDERMRELDKEVKMINDGTHPELSTLMREIEEKREKRLRIAKAWRTHMRDIAQCGFETKEYQAHCTFQSKKRQMRVDMITDLGRKQRKLMFEKALSVDSYCKNDAVPDKIELVRARKQRRSMVNELRAVKQQLHGFPASNKLPTVTSTELDEDFEAMGLSRPIPQTNSADHGPQPHLGGHSGYAPLAAPAESSARSSSAYQWTKPVEYTSGPRPGVEIYVDGNRCKVDGIWYMPNDAVAVLDAVYGQYNARYLYQENDQIMLQRTDGSKTSLHLDYFRARKLYMQPRP